MHIVLVSGYPASGKSAIGRRLAATLGYRFISKDACKEQLFTAASASTHRFFWYEKQAKVRFFQELRAAIARGESVILESNYHTADRRHLTNILPPEAKISEIYCTARGFTTFRRFVRRNGSGQRHPGHHDRKWYPLMGLSSLLYYTGLRWPYAPLAFGEYITVDTTDFRKVDYRAIADALRTSGPLLLHQKT